MHEFPPFLTHKIYVNITVCKAFYIFLNNRSDLLSPLILTTTCIIFFYLHWLYVLTMLLTSNIKDEFATTYWLHKNTKTSGESIISTEMKNILYYKFHTIVSNIPVWKQSCKETWHCVLQNNSVSCVALMVQEILQKIGNLASYFKWKLVILRQFHANCSDE